MAGPVNVTIGGVAFSCVPLANADFSDVAAVYVILCVAGDRSWKVLDVGQSGELGSRIDQHDRRDCWIRNCPGGNIWVCAYPMATARFSKHDRERFENGLRVQYQPICGKR
jgi:hypothetical protein